MIAPHKLSATFYANLVGQIYESALDRTRWHDVLDVFERIYPETRIALFVHRDGRPSSDTTLHRNFAAADLKAYVDYYVTNSPYVRRANKLVVGQPTHSEQYVSVRELVTTEHYNDFVRPRRLGFYATGVLLERRAEGITALSFADLKNDPRRRLHQRRLLEVIAPHVMRALGLSRATARQQAAAGAKEAAFNRWADAAFVLDEDSRMVAMNEAAAELVDADDCISLTRDGVLRGLDDNVSRFLGDAIRRCLNIRGKLDLATCQADRNGVVLPRLGFDQPLQAMVWPLPFVDGREDFGARGRVLVMIFDPQRSPRTGVGWIAQRYRLSASEAALVELLVNGAPLAQAAEALGIQLSTARSRLKAIQLKTGCSRQADLIRLALSAPSIRRD